MRFFFYFSAFVYLFYINFLVIMKLLLCSLSFESLVRFKCFFFAFIHFQLVGNHNKCIIDNFFALVAFVCKLSIVLFLIMIDNFVWVLFFFVISCLTYNVVCFSNDDDDDNNNKCNFLNVFLDFSLSFKIFVGVWLIDDDDNKTNLQHLGCDSFRFVSIGKTLNTNCVCKIVTSSSVLFYPVDKLFDMLLAIDFFKFVFV